MDYLAYFKDDQEVRKRIATGILKIRKENKLTQETLAEMLDVSIEHISRIENCKYTCSITLIFKICSIFKMNIDEFFGIIHEDKNDIIRFLETLPLEKANSIIEFCDKIHDYYKNH